MRKSFDFIPVQTDHGVVFRPLLAVNVEYGGRSQPLQFLVDSGADYSLLGRDAAKLLGMGLAGGRRHDVHGIAGKVACFERGVRLAVPGFEANAFDSTVFVSQRLGLNLLGRDNFFIHFRVGFDLKERRLLLDDRRD